VVGGGAGVGGGVGVGVVGALLSQAETDRAARRRNRRTRRITTPPS
jgi:hypothetical protein